MSNTTYNQFTVSNYTGIGTLTGYTLPITPFTFQLSSTTGTFLSSSKTNNVLWDFGDGTQTTGVTATHYYTFPGVYNVTNYIYSSAGQVYRNTFTQQVSVIDFITDKLTLSALFNGDCLATETAICFTTELDNSPPFEIILWEPTSENSNKYYLRAGRIDNPFTVVRNNSWQTWPSLSAYGYPLNLFSNGADANYFTQQLDKNKYGHLYPYSSFYKIEQSELVETASITTDNTMLYCRLSGNSVVFCNKTDDNSIFCGTSGTTPVYFKTDTPADKVTLYVAFDKNTFQDLDGYKSYPFKYGSDKFGYLNTIGVGISATVQPNTEYAKLSITSNGLDGEGKPVTVFNIDPNKFVGTPINFVVRIKDSDSFTIKYNPLLSLVGTENTVNVQPVIRGVDGYPETDTVLSIGNVESNFGSLSTLPMGGFFKGIFIPNQQYENISLRIVGNVGVQPYVYTLTGYSAPFTVYSQAGKYNIAKINEDYDFTQTLKDLRFQEFLVDSSILFDDFLGSIYGNLSSEPLTLGKVAYEKIANFVANKIDINNCDIQSLYSLAAEVGVNLTQFDKLIFNSPAKLKRLVDIISINHSRLWGTKNKFNLNFNKRAGIDNNTYGANLGKMLDINTTTLTAHEAFVVAKEKYSGKFTLCNTYVLSTSLSEYDPDNNTFPLSTYSDDWGWGLETAGVSGIDIGKYYAFYTYNNITDGTLVNNIINFNDVTNTLQYSTSSYTDWVKKSGIMENMIDYTLYAGLELLSGS